MNTFIQQNILSRQNDSQREKKNNRGQYYEKLNHKIK